MCKITRCLDLFLFFGCLDPTLKPTGMQYNVIQVAINGFYTAAYKRSASAPVCTNKCVIDAIFQQLDREVKKAVGEENS
jgi:hypothetical protein